MKIYTKVGDKGQTQFKGDLISKSDISIEMMGDIDEAQAALSVAYEFLPEDTRFRLDISIYTLYKIMGALYTKEDISDFLNNETTFMELKIDEMMKATPKITTFTSPIGSRAFAQLHLARAVIRRAERSIIKYKKTNVVPEAITTFMNRLSDYVYAAAMYYAYH